MYKVFKSCLFIFFLMDVMNMPFMEIFDTTYPLNVLFWFWVWLFLPSSRPTVEEKEEE